jgi:hypothetical protein
VLLGVLVLACRSSSDDELYLEALGAPPQRALEICVKVGEAEVRADCLLGVAERAATSNEPDLAWAACAETPLKGFQDECAFLVVDRLPLEGPKGWTRCERAGSYRDNCLGHIVTRHLEELDGVPDGVGEEEALRSALAREASKLDLPLQRKHFRRSVTTALTRHVARRWEERPFDEAECGTLDRELCRRSYAETMQPRMDEVDQAAICGSELTREAVEAGGGTAWVQGSEALAREAWGKLCESWGFSAG